MNVNDAINKGKQTNRTAKQRYLAKKFNRPVSTTGILQFMSEQLSLNDYGQMAPINKKNKGMLPGFIRFLTNNGYDGRDSYEFLQKCVENWDDLLRLDMYTENRKKYTLSTVPNIIDIIICKTQIFNEFNTKINDDEDLDVWEEWAKI